MAEAIGVVAATFEFAKVALEIKEVYSSLRHAPEALKLLLEELDALEEILRTLKDQEAALSVFAPPDVVQKCRLQTEKAVNSLKPVSEQLLKCIKRSKLRGSVKALLKEDALEKARQVVERAKTNFILAQMTSLNAMNMFNMRQHVETQTLILSSSASVAATVQDLQRMPQSAALAIPASPYDSALNHEGSRPVPGNSINDSHRQQRTNVRTRRLMLLQSRLLGRAIEFVQLNACGAWSYGFRTYNFRPGDAPVFSHVGQSNVVALQQLFQTGQASILDRDPDGETLLHLACNRADAATIRFLVQQGIDPNDIDNKFSVSCLASLALRDNRKDTFKAIQALKEGAELDALGAPKQIQQSITYFSSHVSDNVLSDLLRMISPPWSTWDLDSRLRAAYGTCEDSITSKAFWLCLSQSQLDFNCLVRGKSIDREYSSYDSLVMHLAGVLGDYWKIRSLSRPDYHGWRKILRTAVSLGGLRAGFDHDCDSPVLAYLGFGRKLFSDSWSDLSTDRLTHKLRYWAKEIINAGQQLEEYGRWEHERIVSKDETFSTCSNWDKNCAECASFRIIKFDYGTDPDDWSISVALSSDEFAGEFFENLESRYRVTEAPGAWPKDTSPHHESRDTQVFVDENGWLQERWVCSRRRRRRFARYFGMAKDDVESMYNQDFASALAPHRMNLSKRHRARQARLFEEAGITPPPRPRY